MNWISGVRKSEVSEMAIRFATCTTDWLMKTCSKIWKSGRIESDVQSRSGGQIVGSGDIAFEVLMVIEIEISNRQVAMHIRNKNGSLSGHIWEWSASRG